MSLAPKQKYDCPIEPRSFYRESRTAFLEPYFASSRPVFPTMVDLFVTHKGLDACLRASGSCWAGNWQCITQHADRG